MSATQESVAVATQPDAPIVVQDEESSTTAARGMVFTSDGSCNPNPGFGGYGAHGYLYEAKYTTKGLGLGSIVATNLGYSDKTKIEATDKDAELDKLLKKWKPVQVSPVNYVNLYGTLAGTTTNNAAEIVALANVLEYAVKVENLSYLQAYSDSEYTINGLTKWMKGWAGNGWLRRDGSAILNVEHWKRLSDAHSAVKAKGIHFKLDWVKGHNGDRANEMADRLAMVGSSQARQGNQCQEVLVEGIDGYWNSSAERHPFIAQKCAYFNTLPGNHIPGRYYLGNQDKNNELAFKRVGDSAFSVVRLATPEPMIEMVIREQVKASEGADSIFAAFLDQIFSPGINKDLSQFKERILVANTGFRRDIWHANGNTPITYEFKPPRLVMRSVDVYSDLEEQLDNFLVGSPKVIATNITSEFFDKIEKITKGKKGKPDTIVSQTKFKSTMAVGLTDHTVKARTPVDGDVLIELKLRVGVDILSRNSLKKIEDLNPSIHVITWTESENVYRYATVIKTDDGLGIWCGYYSNLRVLPVPKP